jgi:RNA polymerase sigma-70 factor (ECF subfamily)
MVAMSMAWAWRPRARPTAVEGWWASRWLALVKLARPPTGDGTRPAGNAAPAGEHGAADFEAFFLRYEHQITSYLWRLTGDEQSASELAQETFLRAWQHFAAVREYERPLAWLFRVATNLARQQHRRRRAPVGQATSLDDEDEVEAPEGDPSPRVAERELVRQTLLELTFQQRAALILCEVHGMSCAEVGELLHLSRGAVKMALWRARERFRVRYLRESEDA